MNKFVVVEFVEEKTVEVVRENWLETSGEVIFKHKMKDYFFH